MRKLSTTVLAVVGTEAEACVRWFADAANVTVAVGDAEQPPLRRAQQVWARTVRSAARFTMHDADPLQPVADAWAEQFDGGGIRGDLEVARTEVESRWRADSIGLPDYYLVLEPEELPPGRKHWYLGVLHRAAPHRVVPVAAEPHAVADAIGRLGAGRWWPELPTILDDLERQLPDQLMVADEVPDSSDPSLS